MSTLKFKKSELRTLFAKLKPDSKLMLVYDQGVYIMSFDDAVEGRTVVYARGCNPDLDIHFYETKRQLVGGDDGADELGTAASMLKFILGDGDVSVTLTATQIKVFA